MDPFVLESAIRLSELLSDAESLLPAFVALSKRPDLVVQRQLVASLGKIPSVDSLKLLQKVLLINIDQPFFREAAINGLADREQEFQDLIGPDFSDEKFRKYLRHCLTPKTTAAAFKAPRDNSHLASFKRGEEFYIANCMACHGPDGNDLDLLGPPLAGSEWVPGSPRKLAANLLQSRGAHRVEGGNLYSGRCHARLEQAPEITDSHLADVATFVRFAWNNGKGAVNAEVVGEVRSDLGDRETVFSPEELLKRYP